MTATYDLVVIPRPAENATDATSLALATKLRELRLHGLQSDPDAFGSSYETEVVRGLDQSLSRMANPKATLWVAIDTSALPSDPQSDVERLLNAPWVGMVGMIGPDEWNEVKVSAGSDPVAQMMQANGASNDQVATSGPGARVSEWHYHLYGMYVRTEARNRGLGKRLVNATVERAHAEASRAGRPLEFSVSVDSENPGGRVMYERVGFVEAGTEEYDQEPRSLLGEMKSQRRLAFNLSLRRDPLPNGSV